MNAALARMTLAEAEALARATIAAEANGQPALGLAHFVHVDRGVVQRLRAWLLRT